MNFNKGFLFNSYSSYLKQKYGQPVYRIGVDAGFSCPNRGKDRQNPGCSYCDENGSRAPYLGNEKDLKEQIEGTIPFLRKRYSAKVFILYFQAFSNTFAPVSELKRIYDYALSLGPFRELIVATRPDCIDEKKAQLLSQYKSMGLDVWVELGLQSSHNGTLKLLNRGHTVEQFTNAYRILKRNNLKVTVHLIFGLPGENWKEIEETIHFTAAIKPDGLKIHNLNIPINTIMFNEFLMGEINAPVAERHIEYTIRALEMMPPETVIMRLTTDTRPERLINPRYFVKKSEFYSRIRTEMHRRNSYQGKDFFRLF